MASKSVAETRSATRRRSLWGAAVVVLLLAAPTATALAGDITAGRKKALQCQACHGLDGRGKIPEAPNLAGQVENYLVKALGDFRSGARRSDLMSIVAQGLKDPDIADLAAYYAAIPVEVGPPPR
ncbi:MAG: c-type cytochrome [Azospirillum sp.]|nr:c-type cytochrome [Azospirillum sp.]